MCQESGVAAWVDADAVPIDAAAMALERERGGDPLALAIHGGEDYELLLAAAPEAVPRLREVAAAMKVALTVIGGFADGEPGVSLRTAQAATPLVPRSHEHFRAG